MASKYQREFDGYVRSGNTDRADQVVAVAKAERDPVDDSRKPARKARSKAVPAKPKRARKA